MGVALVEMIDDNFKATSNVSKPNDTTFDETHISFNNTTPFSIIENYNETDIESNKIVDNTTVANFTETKEFKANGFCNALLLASPVSDF